MALEQLTPILYARDINGTIGFYVETLGFACVNRSEGWASLEKDKVEVMISLPNSHLPFEKPTLTGSLYFKTDDVDGVWEKLRSRAEVVYPIENFDYGMREFAIRDNNGYILQFGQKHSARKDA